MKDPFIGQIIMFGGKIAPPGWAFCDGQVINMADNAELYKILGARYGGNARTTFGLPDLRGRIPMHSGRGPGLTERKRNPNKLKYETFEKLGTQTVYLTSQQIPQHSHTATLHAESTVGTSNNPTGNLLGGGGSKFVAGGDTVAMNSSSIRVGYAGYYLSHNNIQPVQVINYIIALTGAIPSIG